MTETTDFMFFTTDRLTDSAEINEYRTRMAMAMLQVSGVEPWVETGYTFDQRHVTYIMVAGTGPAQFGRVGEVAHMHDTDFNIVGQDRQAYLVKPRTNGPLMIPLGALKLVANADLHDMLLTNYPWLRIQGEDGAEFYTTGS